MEAIKNFFSSIGKTLGAILSVLVTVLGLFYFFKRKGVEETLKENENTLKNDSNLASQIQNNNIELAKEEAKREVIKNDKENTQSLPDFFNKRT